MNPVQHLVKFQHQCDSYQTVFIRCIADSSHVGVKVLPLKSVYGVLQGAMKSRQRVVIVANQ